MGFIIVPFSIEIEALLETSVYMYDAFEVDPKFDVTMPKDPDIDKIANISGYDNLRIDGLLSLKFDVCENSSDMQLREVRIDEIQEIVRI